MVKTGLFDCHCHTNNSPDSKSSPEELCLAAIQKGLAGIAFTDHCNVNYWPDVDVFSRVKNSVRDAKRMQELFGDRLTVLRGIELGNHALDPEVVSRVLDIQDYDIIVGSVHAVNYEGRVDKISKLDFDLVSEEWIQGYLRTYFEETLRMVSEEDIDVVAHISFAVRYMARKKERIIDLTDFREIIEQALKKMIERAIALEINSNDVFPRMNIRSQAIVMLGAEKRVCGIEEIDLAIAEKYYELGGRLITLGSDSHAPERVARGFEQITEKLKAMGFNEAYYFQNRQPKQYLL